MNERIRELADEAGGEFYEGFAGSMNFVKFAEDDFEKFAELIVQECMRICEVAEWGCITHDLNEQARGCVAAREYIAEHFGVEE
jgi:hypothetical protein